jgi:2-oxoisovalerate dehydrogenase E1 component
MKIETLCKKNYGNRLYSEETDIDRIDKIGHLQILFASRLINKFESELVELQKKRLLWGALHPSFGMEVSASAALHALGKNSRINSTHRGHHHILAKGLFSIMPQEWDPLATSEEMNEYTILKDYIHKVFAEILGLKNGFCNGRGGSMHLYDAEVGVHGTNAIVGGSLPSAVGLAFGALHNKSGEVVMSFFGDGASNQGTFHESCNLASVYNLPVIFYLENNQYAVGTKSTSVCSGDCLALRGIGYGMQSYQVDADDPIAVHEAVTEAKTKILDGSSPALIEAIGYRPIHHDSPLPGSAYGYRTKEEEEYWAKRSGYDQYPKTLLQEGVLDSSQLDSIDGYIETLLHSAITPLVGEDKNAIYDELWPDLTQETRPDFKSNATIDTFGRSLACGIRSEEIDENFVSLEAAWGNSTIDKEMSYVQSIANVSKEWMMKDPSVYIWGEDVANFGQGPYGATKKLMKLFPDRVLNTPISESAFVGMALGASMVGVKPIVEIMFPDFVLVAADQFFNQIAKARYMYGGDVDVPIVVRTRIATGTGMGPQHSMDPVALFALFAGWRIIAPSNASEYIGLFNSAMKSNDPVMILEHHTLYNQVSKIPDSMDYCIPFGSARVVKSGTQITCVTYGAMVNKVVEAAKLLEESVSLEIIDLRSLDYPSIDYEKIIDSVKKTKNLLFFEEAPKSQGIASHILSTLITSTKLDLESTPQIIGSMDIPMPVSKPLEARSILSVEDVVTYTKHFWSAL